MEHVFGQLDAGNGFAGDSLLLKAHVIPGVHSLTPIHGLPELHEFALFIFVRKKYPSGG